MSPESKDHPDEIFEIFKGKRDAILLSNKIFIAVVSRYGDLPGNKKEELDALVGSRYVESVIIIPLFRLSEVLIGTRNIPNVNEAEIDELQHMTKLISSANLSEFGHEDELSGSVDIIPKRSADEIVALVYEKINGKLMATMTLYPFEKKEDTPSGVFLDIGSCHLPSAKALEIGRMAKRNSKQDNSFAEKFLWPMAFIAANQYSMQHNLLVDENSFICGNTHGRMIEKIGKLFPIKTINPGLNNCMLDKRDNLGLSIFFILRRVLGQFTSKQLLEIIEKKLISDKNCPEELLFQGMKQLKFDVYKLQPDLFGLYFFHFFYNDKKTQKMLERMKSSFSNLT